MRRSRAGELLLCLSAAACTATFAEAQPAREQFADEIDPAPPAPGEEEAAAVPETDSLGPPAQTPDRQTFELRLAPYGRWLDTAEYGRVWVPDGVGQEWQPYTDGRWVDTDWGWSFDSDVPWGWATYHYGRWGFWPDLGWFWVPGYIWGPAWVAWRGSSGYVCWSALGPRGFSYGRTWPGWVAIDRMHFTRSIAGFAIPRSWSSSIVRASSPVRAIAPLRLMPRQNAIAGAGTRWWASHSNGSRRGRR
jgi:hypothetical protein